jgi:hypothetical protein
MHRLIVPVARLAFLVALLAPLSCGSKKSAQNPSDKADGADAGDTTQTSSGGDNSGGGDAGADTPKKDDCVGFDIQSVEDALLKSACEEAQKPDAVSTVDMKGKLEVKVDAMPLKIAPGAKTDLIVAFTNKTKDNLTLHFRIDPTPRFEVEAYDKKGKRVDMPAGKEPPPPKDAKRPDPTEPKSAKITIAPNGTARAHVSWEAVKTKWAPEKYKGTPPEKGYPRAAAGPLPKGKYTVKVVTPLVGVTEGVDHEVSAPKVDIDVGG